jgi:hypothetical protein
VAVDDRGAARSAAQTPRGGSALTSTSPSLPRSTTSFWSSRAGVALYVGGLLSQESGTLLITITRQGSSEDFFVMSAIGGS